MIILPRQAQDKHRENSKKDVVFHTRREELKSARGVPNLPRGGGGGDENMPLLSTFRASAPSLSRQIDWIGFVQKKRMGTRRDTRAFSRVELPIIHICTILILPRQARDKHRKSKKTLKKLPCRRCQSQSSRRAGRHRSDASPAKRTRNIGLFSCLVLSCLVFLHIFLVLVPSLSWQNDRVS